MLCASAHAQPRAGDLGLGLWLGDPTAGTVKYFIAPSHALEFDVGASPDLTLVAGYSFYAWGLLPKVKKGELAAYLNLGGRIEFQDQKDVVYRTMFGVSYWPHFKRPAEFFVELGPAYRVGPDIHWRIDGAFGARVYFEPFGKKG